MSSGNQIFAAAYHEPASVRIERFEANPIITPGMLPGDDGANINGPSLIRVPDWLPDPLGRYYLYFAHHSGQYIRLAYADRLKGPWRIHQPGVLPLAQAPMVRDHLASPDVLIDHQNRKLRMYFHGVVPPAPDRPVGQRSFLAMSDDGLSFDPRDQVLGLFYFRVFQHAGRFYALAKGGRLYSSDDGITDFQDHGDAFPVIPNNDAHYNAPGSVRHTALHRVGTTLYVFYTTIGDAPERIMLTTIDLSKPTDQWQAGEPVELLRPRTEYEGAHLPAESSSAGAKHGPVNALRDPAIYIENGRVLLVYSIAGESGLAITELTLR